MNWKGSSKKKRQIRNSEIRYKKVTNVSLKNYFNDPNDAGELFANAKFGAVTALSRTAWADIKVSF